MIPERPQTLPGLLVATVTILFRRSPGARLVAAVAILATVTAVAIVLARSAGTVAGDPALDFVTAGGGRDAVDLRVSLVWSGAGYGVAWAHPVDSSIRFARLGPDGARIGPTVAVTPRRATRGGPRLVWNGDTYGVCWTDNRGGEVDVMFTRLSAAGEPMGEPVRVSTSRSFDMTPSLVWSGREYAVAWYAMAGSESNLLLTRLTATGVPVGGTTLVAGPIAFIGAPALAWNGRDYAAGWSSWEQGRDRSFAVMTPITPEGVPSRAIDLHTREGRSGHMAMAATGDRFASVVEQEDDWLVDRGRRVLTFASATNQGVVVPGTTPLGAGQFQATPSLASDGSHLGLAYVENSRESLGVSFALLTHDGIVVGAPIQVSTTRGEAAGPSLAAGGGQFGIAWTLSRGRHVGVYFARLTASGELVGHDSIVMVEE